MKHQANKMIALFTGLLLLSNVSLSQEKAYQAPEFVSDWHLPGHHPDHIVLNLTEDPSTSMSVTWRTSTEVSVGYAEIAVATAAPKFWRNAETYEAKTETMDASEVLNAETTSNYHSVTFKNLQPETLYAYRVGNGKIWSEWVQFRTASKEDKPFSFLYVGDAQNYILELWSRLIREGYRKAPDASFIIHAGDLVTTAHSERQWHEWFSAGGWIHRMLPSVPLPGNHEHQPRTMEEKEKGMRSLSVQWQPQFTLPENGPEAMPKELKETVYYVDYQDTRVVVLNTSKLTEEQVPWLENVLSNNPKKWTVATFHHPFFSASAGRDNEELRARWKPLFDKYNVDIALQGHDHSYARGRVAPQNELAGVNKRDDTGTVYVVSVSGGKMYSLRPNAWDGWEAERDRAAENTQLVQVINVDGDKLSYEAYTATGELYDAFDLVKSEKGKPNKFIERKGEAIAARRHENTISYQDQLPEAIKTDVAEKYSGYELDKVNYVKKDDFTGYYVELEKGKTEVNLTIDLSGKIISEVVEED
ncbi:MAG: metallophosphoesterase family protein [Bacteroidota bacterium]